MLRNSTHSKGILCLLLFICLAFLCFPAHGQHNKRLDSMQVLLKTKLADTTRVKVLNRLSLLYHQAGDMDKAFQYAQKARTIAEKIRYNLGIGEALYNMGNVYMQRSHYAASNKVLEEALRIFKKTGSLPEQAGLLYGLSYNYIYQSDYPAALRHAFACLRLLENKWVRAQFDKNFYAKVLVAISYIYNMQQDYEKALAYNKRALRLFTALQDSVGIMSIHVELGEIQMSMTNYHFSLQHFQQALTLISHMSLQDEKYAFDVGLLQSLEYITYFHIGQICILQAKYQAAFPYLEKALKYYIEENDQSNIASCYIALGDAYRGMNRYQQAHQYVERGLKMAQSLAEKGTVLEGYQVLAKIYQDQQLFQQALEVFQKSILLKDTIFNAEKQRQLLSIEQQYERSQKEKALQEKQHQIEQLEQKQQISRLQLFLLLGLVVAIAAISLLIFRQSRLRQQLNRAQLVALQQRQYDIQTQLEQKNRESTSYSLHLAQKNRLLTDLKDEIEIATQSQAEANSLAMSKFVKAIESNLISEKDWEKFKLVFEGVHPTFFTALQERYPSLTPNDLKLAALLKLNVSSKDMASYLGISEDSVKMGRYRLRKKLQLSSGTNLVDFLLKLS